MRGISTVVDATVCLLLVSGAVATLVAGTGAVATDASPDRADETAGVLATTTAEVKYELTAARSAEGVELQWTDGPAFERTAHGTVASLLADATISGATYDGRRVTPTTRGYERSVAAVATNRTGADGVDASVRVVWEPYPDAPLRGSVRVGARPPPDADVHAATLTVPSGIPANRTAARDAAGRAGFGGVADVVARAVVRGLFPPEQSRLALRDDHPTDALTARRYRRAARLFGARPPELESGSVPVANERLATALAERFERDLQSAYDDPIAAVRDLSTGRVRILVRTWSA